LLSPCHLKVAVSHLQKRFYNIAATTQFKWVVFTMIVHIFRGTNNPERLWKRFFFLRRVG